MVMEPGQIAPAAHELHFDANLRGRDFRFTTTWGLFHPKGVDAGTALLLERLDLGCLFLEEFPISGVLFRGATDEQEDGHEGQEDGAHGRSLAETTIGG